MNFEPKPGSISANALATSGRTAELQRPLVWITWERHRRTRELAKAFGLELVEMEAAGSRLFRYFPLMFWTVGCLVRRRPRVLFVQCPSIVLGCWAVLLKRLFRYRLIADLHNEAVVPFNYGTRAYRAVLRWIWRSTDLNLVTNHALEEIVRREGAAFVLPDRVPALDVGDDPPPSAAEGTSSVVFVCTYAADEPFVEVIEAAALLPSNVIVHVTGDTQRAGARFDLPPNVVLTGFLPDGEYETLLRRADVIIDLTEMDHCLLCGAYEAVALSKPLVTSDTQALRDYFSRGTIYTRHSPDELAAAILAALNTRERLSSEMQELKRHLRDAWDTRRRLLAEILQQEH